MTDQARAYSDEDLTAFLDGEASETLAQSIETDLNRDQGLALRIEALDFPKLDLQTAFATHLADAPPMPALPRPAERPVVAPTARRRGWGLGFAGLGTGIAAGIALALSFGLTSPQPAPQAQGAAPIGWLTAVATYQMLYTEETLEGPFTPDPTRLNDLSAAVDLDLTGLAAVDGLEFRRAQQLGFGGMTLIQVAYTLPDGTPFAICILQSDKPAGAPRFQELRGMQAADWNTGEHGVLIIGGTDTDIVEDLTPRIQALL